jgi:hypothetical protein
VTACLYRSDYGPPTPGFSIGSIGDGLETHASELATAWNPGQLAAMKRQLLRGETVPWCEPGYGWVEAPIAFDMVSLLAGAVFAAVLVRRLKVGSRVRARLGEILLQE